MIWTFHILYQIWFPDRVGTGIFQKRQIGIYTTNKDLILGGHRNKTINSMRDTLCRPFDVVATHRSKEISISFAKLFYPGLLLILLAYFDTQYV